MTASATNVKPGLWFGLVGAPKSGKTHACLSVARLPGEKYAFVAPLGELIAYEGSGITAEPYIDEGWLPSEGKFVSTAYAKMMAKLKELSESPPGKLGAVIFDTMNRGPSELIWHYVLSGYNTDDPRTLGGNSRQPYVTYGSRMTELLERLDLLRYKTGAHVITTFHEDIREVEGSGVARKEFEKDKMTVHWDVGRLPMLKGSMRQDIMGWPDVAFFTEPVIGSAPFRCKFIVSPDKERSVGTRSQKLRKALTGEIPNDIARLVELAR